eukprot:NODE_4624_length_783_cov_1.825613_g4281_i0.p3 GENE.NODE_4624_length_783_cov_1.825613_g4281_i0~~NODE_4624_length_783_cov_1.825613_g4281_i0.p3  ORF type:complete len:104 (-),score=21.31 NODE_4624_length_783_cov_1.825613_g4281_i0:359-670(-)
MQLHRGHSDESLSFMAPNMVLPELKVLLDRGSLFSLPLRNVRTIINSEIGEHFSLVIVVQAKELGILFPAELLEQHSGLRFFIGDLSENASNLASNESTPDAL